MVVSAFILSHDHVNRSRLGATVFLLAWMLPAAGFADVYRVVDHGAVPDGRTLNTAAIQQAIDACSAGGGGTVYFSAGRFLTGTLVLRDRVMLYLESGAVLLGSTDLKDYPPKTPAFRSYTDVNYVDKSLLYAEQARDVAIVGRGVIDGQGGAETFKNRPYKERPYLIRMIECRNVILRDVALRDSPMWVQHYLACENLLIDGVTVHSLVNGNNDGIDVDSCDRVRIANCDIVSGDDAIVLKSTSPRPCRRVTITNCTLRSLCNAFKCGTESTGGFEDVTFSNCVIYDTRLSGIALEAVDGGALDRVLISNVTMVNTRSAIFLRLGNRARPYLAKGPGGEGAFVREEGMPAPGVGALGNVTISNVTATGADPVGCSITGLPGHPVENVTLQNVRVRFAGGGKAELVDRPVPEREDSYPEYTIFGHLPAYGLYCRHVRNLRLDGLRLEVEKPEHRPALVCEDVDGLELRSLDAQPPVAGEAIRLREVRNVRR
ncbi:MAG: exo-poly-alpha-D-galacturonosidase [Phycisphaerae bacterium]